MDSIGSTLSSMAGALGSDFSGLFSTPAGAAAASSPASAAAQTDLSPPAAGSPDAQAAASGGTLSDPTPTTSQGQKNQSQSQQPQYADQTAVNQLKKALQQLVQARMNPQAVNKGSWQPTTAVGGQAPPQSLASMLPAPAQPANMAGAASIPTEDATPASAAGMVLPQLSPTGARSPEVQTGETPADALASQGPGRSPTGPGGYAATPPTAAPVGDPGAARLPPDQGGAPSTTGGSPTPQADDQGRPITVRPKGTGAAPAAAGAPPEAADQGAPPTAAEQPGGPPAPQVPPTMQGLGGQSAMLPLLALAAIALGATAAAGGFGGRHGRGRGGRGGGFRGYHHPGGQGHWPYHHPQQGWQFHNWHPGHPWRPMDPAHMRQFPWFRDPHNWWTAGRGTPSPYPQGWELLLASLLGGGLLRGGQQGQQGAPPQGYPPGMWRGDQGGGGGLRPAGTGGDYVRSGNAFTDALTGIESPNGNVVSNSDVDSQRRSLANGGDPFEISQGFFQIQNYRVGGTWQHYAPQAGVDLNQHPSPSRADYQTQHAVARLIPFSEWGPETKRKMHDKFGAFPDKWTLGQLEDWWTAKQTQAAGAGLMPPQPRTMTGAYSPSPMG